MTNICDEAWVKRKSWPRIPRGAKPLRVVDLFSGCGGLSLGAAEACRINGLKMKVVLALDLHADALAVYRKNFGVGDDVAQLDDIQELFQAKLEARLSIKEHLLRSKCKRVDLLIAGPPCQGHSDLNNSSRRDDPRNSLYFRVVRAAKVLRPAAVVIENVPTVIHDKHKVVEKATKGLESLGYEVSSSLLRGVSIGLAQRRKRHVLVAVKKGQFDFSPITDIPSKAKTTVRDYIGDLVGLNGSRIPIYDFASAMSPLNERRARFLYKNGKYDLPDRLRPKCHRDFSHSYVSVYGRLRWNKPAQTITTGFGSMGQGRYLHPSKQRTITPHEAARLQGFPDYFDFAPAKRRGSMQLVIGNAVPPKFAAVIVDRLISDGHLGC